MIYKRESERKKESKYGIIGALVTMRRGGGRGAGHWLVKRAHVTSGNSLPWICLLRSRGLLVSNPIHQNLCPYPYLCHSVLSLPASQGKWNSFIPSFTLFLLKRVSRTLQSQCHFYNLCLSQYIHLAKVKT